MGDLAFANAGSCTSEKYSERDRLADCESQQSLAPLLISAG
jgi:hypothetical protein